MKKKIFIILFILIICVSIFYICIKEKVDFKRVELNISESINKNILKEYNLKSFNVNQKKYYQTGGLTIKGDLLVLEGRGQKISLEPNLKGDFIFNFELFVKIDNRILIDVYRNDIKIIKKRFYKTGKKTIKRKLKLSAKDKIDIEINGNGAVIIGEPIFYKTKPIEQRQYVFLICADTLRADHLPTYGYKRNTAKNIHSFSIDVVVFKNEYSQSPWTLPSHMSLFTSLYEFNHGIKRGTMLSSGVNFLIEEMSQQFSTRSLNGGIYISSRFGFFRGFDYYKSIGNDQGSSYASKNLFNLAIKDIENNNFPRSFYFLHTYQVHSPYNPEIEYLNVFNKNPKYTSLSDPTVGSNHREQFAKLSKDMKYAYIDLYDAEILEFDLWFGKFINYLKKKKIYSNSMIIFISDHGEEFSDHSGWGHCHSLYNELIRVPLIVKFPKEEFKGKNEEKEVALIDIMPTILNYYNISYDIKNIDGLDLIQVLNGKSKDRIIISSITNGFYIPALPFKISIIENNNKIIYNLPYTDKTKSFFTPPPPEYSKYEYYDLLKDSRELYNKYIENMMKVKKFINLFNIIVKKGKINIKRNGEKVTIDKDMINAFKSLGYL